MDKGNRVVITRKVLENLYEDLDERFLDRTDDFNILASATAISEVRMAGLKKVIKKLCKQLIQAGMTPVADDPLAEFM